MNPETPILQRIRLEVGGLPGVRLFRNQVGGARRPDGSWVDYGLCPGSADLIGWVRRGRAAVFLAIEVKTPTGKATQDQLDFVAAVKRAGGVAGFACNVEQALALVQNG